MLCYKPGTNPVAFTCLSTEGGQTTSHLIYFYARRLSRTDKIFEKTIEKVIDTMVH